MNLLKYLTQLHVNGNVHLLIVQKVNTLTQFFVLVHVLTLYAQLVTLGIKKSVHANVLISRQHVLQRNNGIKQVAVAFHVRSLIMDALLTNSGIL